MIDPIRSQIRGDVAASYQEPSPDLTRRVLSAVGSDPPRRRPIVQALAVTAGLLLVAGAILVARGTHLLSVSQDASMAGLRPPVASYSIVDNQFISASTGWILIQMHVTSGPLVLLKTTDGGAHWVEQFRYTGPGAIDTLQFSRNGREGTMSYLEGGGVLVSPGQPMPPATQSVIKTFMTYDGGTHWRAVSTTTVNNPPKSVGPPPYYFNQPFFLDNNVEGWATRVPSNKRLPILIMHTADAGVTWAQIGSLPAGSGDGTLEFINSKDGWYVVADSRAFAFDAQGHPLPFTPPSAQLYVTHDGGASWSPLTLPLPAAAAEANVDTHVDKPVMFDAKHGVLPLQLNGGPMSATNPRAAMQPSSYVLKTSDGGNHWTDPTEVPGLSEDGDLLFLNLNRWLAASGPFVSETSDGGRTWSTHRVLADGLTLSLASWDYISPNVVWAQVGSGSLVVSTDGGRTWRPITPPVVH